MNPRALIRETARRFEALGIPDPLVDAAELLAHVLNRPPLSLRLDSESVLSPEDLEAFDSLTAMRCRRIPLQYILRTQSFLGRSFQVDERVLIPRPETEILALKALEFLKAGMKVLDLCCGSGCLAVTLALECPGAHVSASDLSPRALEAARENAERLGAEITFFQGDLLLPLLGHTFDLILSNPPYIPDGDWAGLQAEVRAEPTMALLGGTDGLDFYRRIASQAPAFLKRGGTLLLECGDGEAPEAAGLLKNAFHGIRIHPDLQGLERVVEAHR